MTGGEMDDRLLLQKMSWYGSLDRIDKIYMIFYDESTFDDNVLGQQLLETANPKLCHSWRDEQSPIYNMVFKKVLSREPFPLGARIIDFKREDRGYALQNRQFRIGDGDDAKVVGVTYVVIYRLSPWMEHKVILIRDGMEIAVNQMFLNRN